jgi:hypothetical protein
LKQRQQEKQEQGEEHQAWLKQRQQQEAGEEGKQKQGAQAAVSAVHSSSTRASALGYGLRDEDCGRWLVQRIQREIGDRTSLLEFVSTLQTQSMVDARQWEEVYDCQKLPEALFNVEYEMLLSPAVKEETLAALDAMMQHTRHVRLAEGRHFGAYVQMLGAVRSSMLAEEKGLEEEEEGEEDEEGEDEEDEDEEGGEEQEGQKEGEANANNEEGGAKEEKAAVGTAGTAGNAEEVEAVDRQHAAEQTKKEEEEQVEETDKGEGGGKGEVDEEEWEEEEDEDEDEDEDVDVVVVDDGEEEEEEAAAATVEPEEEEWEEEDYEDDGNLRNTDCSDNTESKLPLTLWALFCFRKLGGSLGRIIWLLLLLQHCQRLHFMGRSA